MSELRAARPAPPAEELRRSYLDQLLVPDARAARAVIERALEDGVPAATLYLQVIAPAMHEVGTLWETARITVAQEHLATQVSQSVIAALGAHLTGRHPVGAGRVAIVSATPGELHALGGQMVGDFLYAQGWTVLGLGADVPAHELAELARERQAAVVALSTALPGHLLSVTRTCQLLRRLEPRPYIVAGGRAYGGHASRALAVGADAFAEDPERLLTLLDRRFGADDGG